MSCILSICFLFSLQIKNIYAAENERKCSISIPISVEMRSETGNVTPETLEYILEQPDASEPTEVLFSEISVNKTGVTTGRFEEMSYTHPGDYKYQIYQSKGKNNDIVYDNSVYEVTVRVVNTETGGLTAEIWAVKNQSEQKVDEIKFINYYNETTQATTESKPNTTHHTTNTITKSSIGTSSPKTGDKSNLMLWSAVAAVSALCIFLFVLAGKRREE